MTEEEAKAELFRIHFEYMSYSPKERLKKYEEYKEARNKVKAELALAIENSKSNQAKVK